MRGCCWVLSLTEMSSIRPTYQSPPLTHTHAHPNSSQMITVISFSLPTLHELLSEAIRIPLQILHFIVKVILHCYYVGCIWMWEDFFFFLHQSLEGQIYWDGFKGMRDILEVYLIKGGVCKKKKKKIKPASVFAHIDAGHWVAHSSAGAGLEFLLLFSFYLPTFHLKKETTNL